MKIERGVEFAGARFLLTLQSVDVDTHSLMADNLEAIASRVDSAREVLHVSLKDFVQSGAAKKGSASHE